MKKIVQNIPITKVYCEVCGGARSILRNLAHRQVEVYNDIGGMVVGVFRVLQDPETREVLLGKLRATAYSAEEMEMAQRVLESGEAESVDAAWAFWVLSNCDGNGHSGVGGVCSDAVGELRKWCERFARVQVDDRDTLVVIKYWDTAETTFYVDPWNDPATRLVAEDEGDEGLVDVLLGVEGCCVVRGNRCEKYEPLGEAGWKCIPLVGNGGGEGDVLWLNQAAVRALEQTVMGQLSLFSGGEWE